MPVTKFAAHPLVVAVALGLLTPDALSEAVEEPSRHESAHRVDLAGEPVEVREIDAAEFARVEQEWVVARDLISD